MNKKSGKTMKELSKEYRSSKSESEDLLTIEDLPPEIIEMIISGLPTRDVLNFCRTRKEYRMYCDSETLWRALYERSFGKYKSKGQTWKNAYRTKFLDMNDLNLQFLWQKRHEADFPFQPKIGKSWVDSYTEYKRREDEERAERKRMKKLGIR